MVSGMNYVPQLKNAMRWSVFGIGAVRHGSTNINTAVLGKHYVLCTPGNTRQVYDEAKTYHDGKWTLFMPEDTELFGNFIELPEIKRKPNRKQQQL